MAVIRYSLSLPCNHKETFLAWPCMSCRQQRKCKKVFPWHFWSVLLNGYTRETTIYEHQNLCCFHDQFVLMSSIDLCFGPALPMTDLVSPPLSSRRGRRLAPSARPGPLPPRRRHGWQGAGWCWPSGAVWSSKSQCQPPTQEVMWPAVAAATATAARGRRAEPWLKQICTLQDTFKRKHTCTIDCKSGYSPLKDKGHRPYLRRSVETLRLARATLQKSHISTDHDQQIKNEWSAASDTQARSQLGQFCSKIGVCSHPYFNQDTNIYTVIGHFMSITFTYKMNFVVFAFSHWMKKQFQQL